jgi:hypothetical protein
MLRITIQPTADGTIFKLQGTVGGPWVHELERLWHGVREETRHRPVRADLTAVVLVDQHGKRVLKWMYEDGVELIAEDSFMKAIIEDVIRGKGATVVSKRAGGGREQSTVSLSMR